MTSHPFAIPITVFSPRLALPSVVSTVAQAADFLFDNWPGNDSGTWTRALHACHSAEVGEVSVEAAEMAVFAALRVAGFRIEEPKAPG